MTWVACTGILAYAALRFLREFRKRNDVLDQLMHLQREIEERLHQHMLRISTLESDQQKAQLDHTSLSTRVDNMLANQEHTVERFGKLKQETEDALKNLAAKWLDEIQQMNTRQAAVMTAPAAPRMPRFRP